jgi:hypothetical protein
MTSRSFGGLLYEADPEIVSNTLIQDGNKVIGLRK